MSTSPARPPRAWPGGPRRWAQPHHAWAAGRNPGPSVPGETRALARVVAAVDPDVVVLHSAKAGLAGRLALRGRRRTVVRAARLVVRGRRRRAVATASTGWEVAAGRWTDMVVCVSEDERRRGRRVGVACPMDVVPNGVDVEAGRPRPAGPGPARAGPARAARRWSASAGWPGRRARTCCSRPGPR